MRNANSRRETCTVHLIPLKAQRPCDYCIPVPLQQSTRADDTEPVIYHSL